MIASTPVDGGHYFCDAIAGIAIAFACWFAARWTVRTYQAEDAALLPPVAETPSIMPDIVTDGTAATGSLDLDLTQSINRVDVTQER